VRLCCGFNVFNVFHRRQLFRNCIERRRRRRRQCASAKEVSEKIKLLWLNVDLSSCQVLFMIARTIYNVMDMI
jgi:hypothetical protein